MEGLRNGFIACESSLTLGDSSTIYDSMNRTRIPSFAPMLHNHKDQKSHIKEHEERNCQISIDYHALDVHQGFFYYFVPRWLPLLFLSPSYPFLGMIVVAPILLRLVADDANHLPCLI
ncbi:hypothetical protein M9H77_17310 [Catharanthus roseus]|uniref:Uncharacterized protein n=1 Tax=Catharanthus roseus TaxID=4058 RepID=A0ACC0B480_CATRO|nr:hypothetical protein M9H77_17310 [Catharanthus roseus]